MTPIEKTKPRAAPNLIVLHPEALIDRAASLDAARRALLHAHLARCLTCALELQVRAYFAVEIERDAPRDANRTRDRKIVNDE